MEHVELFSEQEWTLLTQDLELSRQQARIVDCIVHAKSDKQIAQELGISQCTVRTHVTRLFQKFGLNDRVELLVHVFMSLRNIDRSVASHAET